MQIGAFEKRNWTPASILIVSKLVSSYGLKAKDFKENWKNYSFEPGFSEEATTHLEDIEKWGFEHGSFPKDYNIRDFINTDVAKIAFPDNVTIE